MKKCILFSIILLLSSCSNILKNYYKKRHEKYLVHINESINKDNCNFDNAKRIADSLFEYQLKFDMKKHYEKYSENDTSYVFQLFHNRVESNVPSVVIVINGGGGEITISKKDCKVIKILGYQ